MLPEVDGDSTLRGCVGWVTEIAHTIDFHDVVEVVGCNIHYSLYLVLFCLAARL